MKSLFFIALVSWCGILQANSCDQLFEINASQLNTKKNVKNPSVHPLLIPVFERADELLIKGGMYDTSKLRAALLAKAGGAGAIYLKIIETGQFDVVIRRPEEARESVLKDGLTNVHETNLTMGATLATRARTQGADLPANANVIWRSRVEATYLGLSQGAYGRINAKDKPKYGYIRMSPTVKDGGDSHGTGFYGTDSWVLKKDSIRKRTSFTMGDSQDRFPYGFPGSTKEKVVNTEPSDWSSSLLSLEHLPLIIPEVLPEFFDQQKLLFRVAPYSTISDVQDVWEKMGFSKLKRAYKRPALPHPEGGQKNFWANSAPYIETQIFGELPLQDIEAFEFKKNPPSREFCQQLRKRNIIIRDGRVWPPVEYVADLN